MCYPNTKSSTYYHNLTKQNEPKIDWDNKIQGHLLSAQSIGYILGNFVGGPLCGYFGGKKVMAAALVMNGLSQFASPFLSQMSHWSLFICQFVVGICVSTTAYLVT